MISASRRAGLLAAINGSAPPHGSISFVETSPFGPQLTVDRYRLQNGLELLLLEDRSAPVIAFHTWFRVGSRHERPTKTGLAHLFEHLMFNETEGMEPGEFDIRMEQAGADNNASTWLDFTQYQEAFPRDQLRLVIDLEARRLNRLRLQDIQVESEKEVVANERRYRVEDDVEGAVDELLWKTAFREHPYHWPTIGWMEDIAGFTTEDCTEFYSTYYCPNNATIVVVGDFRLKSLLELISTNYGRIAPGELPVEDISPEPPQTQERRVETRQPTATEKLTVGYKGPRLGDADHLGTSILVDVLTGGRASRLHRRLVGELGIATEVRGFVGPHRDPSLVEFYVVGRQGIPAEQLLAELDRQVEEVLERPVTAAEIERARARMELSLLSGLESADGKASTIGFFEAVLRRPNAAFERLRDARYLDASDLLRAARTYLRPESRTVVMVRREEDR